jgi:hypothetical protein
MESYQLRMFYKDGDKHTAGSKATLDCAAILSTIGFKKIDVPIYLNRSYTILNILQTVRTIVLLFLKIKRGSTILVQYPLLGINNYLSQLASAFKWMGCKSIILIHDVDSLRQHGANKSMKSEIDRFNMFDFVISHNRAMTAKLVSEGLKAKAVNLELFDYLFADNATFEKVDVKGRSVSFAGNLGKSEFLKHLKEIRNVKFNLYGPGFDKGMASEGVTWKGSFPPEELPLILNGGFGLIWDGSALEECNGVMGAYLQYNNPHKASLYIVSGLPLIAPDHSAIGAFIKENKIGITITSLFELDSVLNSLTDEAYLEMCGNVQKVKGTVSQGRNLIRSIEALDLTDKLN